MHPNKTLAHYFRTRFDSWRHFAQDQLDLDISPHNIMFVYGTVKTDDWGLGAFLRYESGGAINFEETLINFFNINFFSDIFIFKFLPDKANGKILPNTFFLL